MAKNEFSIDHRNHTKNTKNNHQLIKNSLIYNSKSRDFASFALFGLWGKSPEKAPFQVNIVNDKTNNNLLLLETKRITEPEQKSVLESSMPNLQAV